MLRDNIKRREGFLQGIESRNISEHSHSYYDFKDLIFYTGELNVASLTDIKVGQIIPLEPLYFMEAVGAKLYLTGNFSSGGIDTYTLSVYADTLLYTITKSDNLTSELITFNITTELKHLFKNAAEKEVYLLAKVSDIAHSLRIKGAMLRIYTSARDSFGASQNKVSQYLADTGLVEKDYLTNQLVLDEELEYISEIPNEFGSR